MAEVAMVTVVNFADSAFYAKLGCQAAGGYFRLLKKCELSHDQLA